MKARERSLTIPENIPESIPENVERLLWEYDLDAIRALKEPPDVLIERVMARGGWDEMRWLLSTCDQERLRDFLERRGKAVLAPREIAFWSMACSVSEEQAARWLRDARENERAWRG